ncbi:MAG: PKD repeat protein [Polaribacter sp.]|jgi:PKD repeat protein
MKNSVLLFLAVCLATLNTNAQNAHCGFDEHLDRMLAEDPSGIQVIKGRQAKASEITRGRLAGEVERAGGPRIIPTVFHVIHQGGNENISKEQIEDQMRILNEDFSRTNADAANTRDEFLSVAANPNIEFRLAKLDPQGNCTDGIVRVWSPLTNNATDDVKAVSYWNSDDYFNIWLVNTIDNDGEQGTILGYAQFPGFGSAATDGVVVRADYTGGIGTGASNGSRGRTLTHEAGHWLGLLHTFQGGCNGGFFGETIDDTPPIAEATQGGCPHNANTCSNDNPDLPDMVENYMDYTNGSCQNIYTLGQKDAFDAVLSGSRSNLVSTSNLNSTGVLLADNPCAPIAQFFAQDRIVCAGQNISFEDASFNGTPTTYSWDLTGATPDQSSDASPTVVYNASGVYSITMNVSNAQGGDSFTHTDYITVLPSEAAVQSYFSFEGFEETEEDYIVISDNFGSTWQENDAAFTDSKSIMLNNFNGNPLDSEDEFQLASVNLTQMNDPDLYFRLSYKQRSGGANDNLRIYVSRDCGDSWQIRYQKSGASLATVSGTQGSPFTPNSEADWELVDVNLSLYANDEHVLVKFRGTSDEGNNIYIDDIQISGPLGVPEQQLDFDFSVGPNPVVGNAKLSLNVVNAGDYQVALLDVTGKQVALIHSGELSFGSHDFVIEASSLKSAGVYLIQIDNDQGRSVRKLVIQ